MGAIFLILFIVGIAVGIYKIGSKSADDAKAIGKYDIEDLQRREYYDYADSEEEEEKEERKRKEKRESLFEHKPYAGPQGLGLGYDDFFNKK